ncbi:uncharacterized protein LOC129589047 [Paramacrobiotus metropolitanus]|uniref:uncharacterized protein LOC129589047 n=2 Tax=Paramacrobiotus metropolitanus TaxID=2943436 RepID=UPI002445C1A2|nr:uncharacterized protein LOC129589047 [Paramacrobiotus metropolitanus]
MSLKDGRGTDMDDLSNMEPIDKRKSEEADHSQNKETAKDKRVASASASQMEVSPYKKEVEDAFLCEVSLPIRNLRAPSAQHQSRIMYEDYRDVVIESLKNSDPKSAQISLTGVVQSHGKTRDVLIQEAESRILVVEILDGQHRLESILALVKDCESRWTMDSLVKVAIYVDLDDNRCLFLSRARNTETSVHREETVFDTLRLFRKICYNAQNIQQEAGDLQKTSKQVQSDNKMISKVTGIPLKTLQQCSYKFIYQCAHLPVKTFAVLNRFMVKADAGEIKHIPKEKKSSKGMESEKKEIGPIIFRRIKLGLKTSEMIERAFEEIIAEGDWNKIEKYVKEAAEIPAEEDADDAKDPDETQSASSKKHNPHKRLKGSPQPPVPSDMAPANSSDDLASARAEAAALKEKLDHALSQLAAEQIDCQNSRLENSEYQRETCLLKLERARLHNVVKTPCKNLMISKMLNVYYGGKANSSTGKFDTSDYGVLQPGVLVYSKVGPAQIDPADIYYAPADAVESADPATSTLKLNGNYFTDLL